MLMEGDKVRKFLEALLKPTDMFYKNFIDSKNNFWVYLLFCIIDSFYLYKVADMVSPFLYDTPRLSLFWKILIVLIGAYIIVPFDIHKEDTKDKNSGLKGGIFALILLYEIMNFMNIHIFFIAGEGKFIYRLSSYMGYMAVIVLFHPFNKRRLLFKSKA